MVTQNLSQNLRIASLSKLTHELSHCATPDQTLRALQQGFREAYGFVAWLLVSTVGLPEGHYRVIATQFEGQPLNYFWDKTPTSVYSGGIVSAVVARPEPQLVQEVDWATDPRFNHALGGYSSVIAIPVSSDHLPLNWVILLKPPAERFTEWDLEEAVQRVALISSLLEKQTLASQLALANEQIDRDARRVGEVQRALLPLTLPKMSGLEVAARYEPSGRAGGDLYDFFPLHESRDAGDDGDGTHDRWCVLIGDAAGHGLAAAVVMAIVQSVLHSRPSGIAGPADLLRHANRELCHKNIGGFFTAFLGIYEPSIRRLIYANAGHPPPLLKRSSDGAIYSLDSALSHPLGIDESMSLTQATITLEPEDTIVLYTDGITEARDPQGNFFEQERLVRVLQDAPGGPSHLVEHLLHAIQAHEQEHSAADDQTLVAVRVC
jgi:sigma-B regulation protein RsbU (phosphoserine phosphatase)